MGKGTPAMLARALRGLAAAGLAALLAACGTVHQPALRIDHSIQAKSQDSRVSVIVLHYTVAGNAAALDILSRGNVSSHYLITDAPTPHVYQLVDENRRAWHAGVSSWYGRSDLNASSIGIEIVNRGPLGDGRWAPYSRAQIATLTTLLHGIIRRHQIKPFNIVGHSDIAPQRKTDPGPAFPWAQLARAGIGRWYDADQARQYRLRFEQEGLPPIDWVQRQLRRVGYDVPDSGRLDPATRRVIAAFQMHYRPADYSGEPDAETLGILQALP
ncbi:N-acetylmuramoyl-L-alanine amidase [Candidimonas nitroreducens]|nr:N-acetylmuramoyl-L-alanine amidase [Candidimonas nitroreducens]